MLKKILEWLRRLLYALFPEDMLKQIRIAAGGGGEEEQGEASGQDGPADSGQDLSEEEMNRMRETPMERRHIVFFGRVQGVGFRYHAMYGARNYGLTGWVENRYDGSVEMEIQGPRAVIDHYLENLGDGRWIRIDSMDSEQMPVIREERGFHVH